MLLKKMTSFAAATTFVVAAAPQAQAHDITDAFLTERSANCAHYVAEHTASATDAFTQESYEAKVTITTDEQTCTITSNSVPNHDFNTPDGFMASLHKSKPTP